jgi:hypothetical protein
MAAKRGPKGPMTDDHKAALAVGRAESKVVRDYLEALRTNKPKRGRRRTTESITARLSSLDEELLSADPLTELKLVQERMNLQDELDNMGTTVDIEGLENEFIAVAGSYSQRQGISYAAWRQVGVEPSVLSRSGISRAAG